MKLPGCEDEKRSTAAGGERKRERDRKGACVCKRPHEEVGGGENDREGTTDRNERLRGSREGGKEEE